MGEQPIFTCKAHVFHIDPKTKRSWIPASSSAISVSFFYDSTRSLYRIISVEGTKAVINSTITPSMAFTKTSQKFGQWSDVRANTVYGLGFPSEAELNKFIEKFQEVKEATKAVGGPAEGGKPASSANGSTTPIPAANSTLNSTTVSANASPVSSRSAVVNSSSLPPLINAGTKQSGSSDDLVDGTNNAVSPALLKSALASHQRSQSLSGLQPAADSPKHAKPEKNPLSTSIGSSATLPTASHLQSVSADSQLKYENDRLKLALAQSSANAKKWEVELATLKNNNARLTSALQESTANVEEWKRQLQAYKDENTRLKNKVLDLETGKGPVDSDAKRELEILRQKVESLETEAREKDEEIRKLTSELRGTSLAQDKYKKLEEENSRLEASLKLTRNQLESLTSTSEGKRRTLEILNAQLFDKIQELKNIHSQLDTALDT